MGAGAVGVAASEDLFAAGRETVEAQVMPAGQASKISLRVNGATHVVLAEPRWTLLYCLRDVIGLTGAKPGCERGECGACTVLIDGVPRYACLTLAVEVQGREVTTLEGLMDGEALGPVQTTFAEADAFQCGYCTPGQIMSVEGLLRANPHPSAEEIRRGVSGNLCRCGAYKHIFEAARRAAELKGGK
jgi:xanthine dehydrogenase YagT iron-sulfur-binding subunit